MFGFLRRFFAHDLAMDLGTANTLLSSAREDLLVNEPSVVALDAASGAVLAVGAQAKAYAPEVRSTPDQYVSLLMVSRVSINSSQVLRLMA